MTIFKYICYAAVGVQFRVIKHLFYLKFDLRIHQKSFYRSIDAFSGILDLEHTFTSKGQAGLAYVFISISTNVLL